MSRLIRTFPTLDGAPVRVMVCEDAVELRQLLRDVLAAEPGTVQVGEAEDGVRALARVGAAAPEVILLDLGMPGPSPVELVTGLARAAPKAAIVLYSGTSVADLGHHRRLVRMELDKSTPPVDVVQRIRDLGWARRDQHATLSAVGPS